MARRKLALQAPLYTGLEFTLALEPPRQNPSPNARKLPRVPSLSPTALQLREELQRGIDGFSQVWTAVCGDDPETCLILKIIQPSICRGIPLDTTEEYFEPWDLVHNEAWVYRHLAHYQGLLIPYFFGLSTIVTPCGEEAWVLVFEFIPGLTVNGVADSGSISDIRDFVRSFTTPGSVNLTRSKPVCSGCKGCGRLCSWWLGSPRYTAAQLHSDTCPRCMGRGHH
ncbi:hypothetical protein C8F04DRAFT_980432 [Mycena alexandri]|uniref:Uncharacterized protein n=1 Tax=Mycena alexandri TaxID=1745969 RepID=A0AAD6RX87_9AGAR|nr:hypothetical protein C8F04DRAFT_980432 [Mycena alexandri]